MKVYVTFVERIEFLLLRIWHMMSYDFGNAFWKQASYKRTEISLWQLVVFSSPSPPSIGHALVPNSQSTWGARTVVLSWTADNARHCPVHCQEGRKWERTAVLNCDIVFTIVLHVISPTDRKIQVVAWPVLPFRWKNIVVWRHRTWATTCVHDWNGRWV